MAGKTLGICVLGGTGFVGTELVTRLADAGHLVRVPTRKLVNGNHLKVLPTVQLVVANVHDSRALGRLFEGMDVIINLVGILNESGKNTFRRVHAELAGKIVEAMRTARVPRLLQMSAIGAGAQAPSRYLRSKGEAEALVRVSAATLSSTIIRPSVIFGPRDTLTNRFAGLLRLGGGFLPLARPRARFAPIYVHDVVEAFIRVMHDRQTIGKSYELCGPDVVTLAALVKLTAVAAHLPCHVIPLPDFFGRLQALVMDVLPGHAFSSDNYRSLTIDSLCKQDGCAALGINPAHMSAIVPGYLDGHATRLQLDGYRRSAGGG